LLWFNNTVTVFNLISYWPMLRPLQLTNWEEFWWLIKLFYECSVLTNEISSNIIIVYILWLLLMLHRYDPNTDMPVDIDTPQDRVIFIKSVASFMVSFEGFISSLRNISGIVFLWTYWTMLEIVYWLEIIPDLLLLIALVCISYNTRMWLGRISFNVSYENLWDCMGAPMPKNCLKALHG